MNKNNKNEELQSRREFFKKAAKGVLPILGAVVLANVPNIANASASSPMGCETCVGNCYGCSGTCGGKCQGCSAYCTHGSNK